MRRASIIACVLLVIGLSAHTAAAQGDCYGESIQGRIEGCAAIIGDPATDSFDRANAYAIRGQALALLKRYAEGIADLDKSLEINPDSAYALNNRAWAYFKWKRSSSGLADVERSIALDPRSNASWDTRAHIRQVQGNFQGAFDDYETAIGLGGTPVIRVYQCGLSERGLYHGPLNGVYTLETRAALKTCAFSSECDPLPDDVDVVPEHLSCSGSVS